MSARILFWDVDTQGDFMLPSGSLYVSGAEKLRPNLARLTEAAREQGIPIVHTADDHELSDAEIAAEGADFVDTFPPHCLRGTPGAERVPETAPAAGALDIAWDGTGFDPDSAVAASEIVVRKKRFDAFSNPATPAILDALHPATVVVYGVALDICDRYAVEGMLGLGGFEVVLVDDAVAAVDPVRGAELVADWRKRGVRVLSTDAVLAECGAGG
jgi:nicotinamidase/pyrazinamidase